MIPLTPPPPGLPTCAGVGARMRLAAPGAPLTPRLCPQVSVLVFFALAFLTCVIFLVVYKVYKYERLCPDGFILKVKPLPQPREASAASSRLTSRRLRTGTQQL